MPVIRKADRIKERLIDDPVLGTKSEEWISEPGGLSLLGALVESLEPGARSSLKHWHQCEDEMIFLLSGCLTVVEGDGATALAPGDAATFKAGVETGHYLENRSDQSVSYLVVGTRAPVDRITYPDHDRVCVRDRNEPDDIWEDLGGRPASSPY